MNDNLHEVLESDIVPPVRVKFSGMLMSARPDDAVKLQIEADVCTALAEKYPGQDFEVKAGYEFPSLRPRLNVNGIVIEL